MLHLPLILCLSLAPSPDRLDRPPATTEVSTTAGSVAIREGNVAAARQEAIAAALHKALFKVAAALLKPAALGGSAPAAGAHQAEVAAQIESRILARPQAYIQSYRVLSAKPRANVLYAVVEAIVRTSTLRQDVEELRHALAVAEYPKVLFLFAESYLDNGGQRIWVDNPVTAEVLEQSLAGQGFVVVAKQQSAALQHDLPALAQIVDSDARVAELAHKYGADVAWVATTHSDHRRYDRSVGHPNGLSVEVHLRAVRADTGTLLARLETPAWGTGSSAGEAHRMAVRKMAPGVSGRLVERLLRVWNHQRRQGHRVVLVIDRVAHYRRQAQPLMGALGRLPQVKSIKEIAYKAKRLELEVFFQGDAQGLLDTIFATVPSERALKRLGQGEREGDVLSFSL